MYFKIVYTIVDGHLGRADDGPIILSLPGKSQTKVVIRAPTDDEKSNGHTLPFCEASCLKTPNPKIEAMFQSLSEGKLPDGSDLSHRGRGVDEKGRIEPNRTMPYDALPGRMQSFISTVTKDLSSCLNDTFNLLRWRDNIEGRHNPFASKGAYWSFDATDWFGLPTRLSANITTQKGIVGFPELCQEVVSLYENGVKEPLAHELLREAREQTGSNPRSSLVIGVTAAEAAVKNLIVKLQPENEWLLQNMPSPDVLRMLKDYVPKLAIKSPAIGKAGLVPTSVHDNLRKGISIRNVIVHGGSGSIKPITLRPILASIEDFVWLMDYYGGYSWAINNVSEDTIDEMKQV